MVASLGGHGRRRASDVGRKVVRVEVPASAVDAVFETVQNELKAGGDIRLAGFGSFSVSHRKATKGRNPATREEVDIPARNVPKFSAGKGLKDAVNS